MLSPQFCTWGAQAVRGNRGDQLTQPFLDTLYDELQRSGMQATLFSIDDKWEGTYGALTHDEARLPRFEHFLDRVRAGGHRIGLWTALMRCEDPARFGLTLDNMLRAHDGTPLREGTGYYLLDFTQPAVAAILQQLARRFMQRYKPDLVKFDFGYELPNVSQAAPADRAFMGERLLTKGLEVVIPALREVNPDVVVMYYNLSPLYLPYFDLHALDDIFQAYREFSLEANRRLYFSSLLGSLGVPTYGSSGYDWSSAPEIWFDSAASGTIGSLNDFNRDEAGEPPTPQLISRYNGVAKALRSTRVFDVLPIGPPQLAPTLGAHAHSWVRLEDDEAVLLARRPTSTWSDLPNPLPALHFELANLAVAAFPLIVSSTTSQRISRSRSLIVVPLAEGPISLKTELRGKANLRLHHLVNKITLQTAETSDGWLRFTPKTHPDRTPLEYIELHFGD